VKIVCKIAAGLVLSVLPLLAAAAPLPASAAAAASAASAAGPELAAFKKAIRSKYDLKERAFAAHDPAPILEHFYTADVISVGEGEGIFIGREQIRPLYEEVVRNNRVKIESVYTFVAAAPAGTGRTFTSRRPTAKSLPLPSPSSSSGRRSRASGCARGIFS